MLHPYYYCYEYVRIWSQPSDSNSTFKKALVITLRSYYYIVMKMFEFGPFLNVAWLSCIYIYIFEYLCYYLSAS